MMKVFVPVIASIPEENESMEAKRRAVVGNLLSRILLENEMEVEEAR